MTGISHIPRPLAGAIAAGTLAVLLTGCASTSAPLAPGSLIEPLCAKRGPGLHLLDEHSTLWCGTPREGA